MITSQLLLQGNFGLEKENVRVNQQGELSMTPHPPIFGKDNPYITTDFSESQLEMITPVCDTIAAAYDWLENINHVVSSHLGAELLWPQSNPPALPKSAAIPLAQQEKADQYAYRSYLATKYGRKRALLSGIHFNMNFAPQLVAAWHAQAGSSEALSTYTDQLYLKVTAYFMKYRWFFIYLFGASPTFHESYSKRCALNSEQQADGSCQIAGLDSLRNSMCGFRNPEALVLNYQSVAAYEARVAQLIATEQVVAPSEIYTAVRPKMMDGRIKYLEFRFIDTNPFVAVGVNKADLELLHLFALYFAQCEAFDFDEVAQARAERNQHTAAYGSKTAAVIMSDDEEAMPLGQAGNKLLTKLAAYLETIPDELYAASQLIQAARLRFEQPEVATYAARVRQQVQQYGYIDFHLAQATQFLQARADYAYTFSGYEDMELSTQLVMQAAVLYGLQIEVLDRSEQFLRLCDTQRQRCEFVKEATKTSLDRYSQVLVMENKVVTKQVLAEKGLHVPQGFVVHVGDEAQALYQAGKLAASLVVKPNTTNFGIGITIFTAGYTAEDLQTAVNMALSADETVLLEAFQQGEEYRILVLDGEAVAVLKRRAANVVGDGKHSIQQLVAIKNDDPLRGTGYRRPLEQLRLDEEEIRFLAQHGYDVSSIPSEGERVYLRHNSNISTGGDSIDCTEMVHPSYLAHAVAAAQALDVVICGIDMIIADIEQPATAHNYAIIEANFNPAIHIHCFPYEGKRRPIGEKVVQLLKKRC